MRLVSAASHCRLHRTLLLVNRACTADTQISQHCFAFLGHQHICGLDVLVENTLLVEMVQPARQLMSDGSNLFFA